MLFRCAVDLLILVSAFASFGAATDGGALRLLLLLNGPGAERPPAVAPEPGTRKLIERLPNYRPSLRAC